MSHIKEVFLVKVVIEKKVAGSIETRSGCKGGASFHSKLRDQVDGLMKVV